MRWFLNLLDRIGRKRIVIDRQDNEPYLERYYLFLKDRKLFPFNIFIHKFLKSDPDDVHDHPWPYATLILKGGYYEWTPDFDSNGIKIGETRHWRSPGHFRVCGANSYHRIELCKDVPAWTMFMPGPQQREWGFLVNNKWIHNDEYLNMPLKQFYIDEAHITSLSVHKEWGMYNHIPQDELSHEQLLTILKGKDRYSSSSTIDHPEFTALREQLGKLGYISIERGWWNGDRVLKSFKLNGWTMCKGHKFPCADALKISIKCALKHNWKSISSY